MKNKSSKLTIITKMMMKNRSTRHFQRKLKQMLIIKEIMVGQLKFQCWELSLAIINRGVGI